MPRYDGGPKPQECMENIRPDGDGIHEIDIVIVHGVGRYTRQSWASDVEDAEKEWMWLDRVSDARWLMFNYDSVINAGIDILSVDGLSRVAELLLKALSCHRSRPEDKEKPIAFVAHDFGGIIVKKALIMAEHHPSYFKMLHNCGKLVFFGTPHRSSNYRSWEDSLLGILLASPRSLAPVLAGNLATRLRRLSRSLEDISIEFLSSPVRRCSINVYQDTEHDKKAELIVDRYSASTGLVHDTNIPVSSKHGDMYKSLNDGPVFAAIVRVLDAEAGPAYRACLSRLFEISPGFVVPDDQRDLFISRPAAEVQAGFASWLESPSPCIVAVSGDRGTGKSLVARTLFRKARELPGLAAYFSFSETDVRRASVVAFLSSVVFQILVQDPPRFSRVEGLVTEIEDANAWTEAGLLALFKSLLDIKTEKNSINLVVNGLHQCASSCRKLLDILADMIGKETRLTTLKVAIFSQPHPDLGSLLDPEGRLSIPGSALTTVAPKPMAGALAVGAIDDRPYLYHMVTQMSVALEKCRHTIEMLLAIQSLDDAAVDSAPRTLRSLELVVANMRPSLPETVSSRYRALPAWGRTALGWILHSKRPLGLKELGTALVLTGGMANFTASFDPKDLPVDLSADIRIAFGPLIRIEDGGIVFGDDRVRKHFLRLTAEVQEPGPSKSRIPSDENITAILLNYLSWPEFADPVNGALSKNDGFVQPPGPLFNLMEYAIRFLSFHVQACKDNYEQMEDAMSYTAVLMWSKLNSKLNVTAAPPDLWVIDPVLLATQLGLEGTMQRLEKDMDLSLRQAVLNLASWRGYTDMVDFVFQGVKEGEVLDCTTALEHASARGHDDIVGYLTKYMKSASASAEDPSPVPIFNSLLCQAAGLGYEEQVFLFLSNGADPNAAPNGKTPLQLAVRNGHASIVHRLLARTEKDVDVNSEAGTAMEKPILLAADKGYELVLRCLLDAHADVACVTADDTARTPLYLAAENGHMAIVELLLEADKETKAVIDRQCCPQQDSPLMIACKKGHPEVAKCLLHGGASIKLPDRDGRTALYHALRPDSDALAMLILDHTQSMTEFEDRGQVFLRVAELGLIRMLQICLGRGPDVDINHKEENSHHTALHKAAMNGHANIAYHLLDRAANVDPQDKQGDTPLVLAALAGQPEIVGMLLDHGADPGKGLSDGLTIVSRVARCPYDSPRHGRVVTMLLEAGVDVNTASSYKERTALHWAAAKGKLEITKALLRRKSINADATARWLWNALHLLAKKKHRNSRKIGEILIEAGTSPMRLEVEEWLPLHVACKSGNIPLMELLWEHNPESLEARVDDGRTPIHFGVQFHEDSESVIKWLIDHGADRNATDVSGSTAMIMAAKLDLANVIRVLSDMGCDTTRVENAHRHTALHVAAACNSLSAGRELLKANIGILSLKDVHNLSALHVAIIKHDADFALMLLNEFYAQPSPTDDTGTAPKHSASEDTVPDTKLEDLSACDNRDDETPLITAIARRQWSVMDRLLQLGAGIENRDKSGRTALLVAVKMIYHESVKLEVFQELLSRADVNGGGGNYTTALHDAAEYGEQALLKELIEKHHADVNKLGGKHGTVLGAAVASGWTNIVEYLLELKEPSRVDINNTDIQGRSAFHLAARRGTWNALQILLSARDSTIPGADKHGRWVLHFAAMSGHCDSFLRVLADERLDWDIDVEDADGWTALHWACRQGENIDIVKALVKYGADCTTKTTDGWTPEEVAIAHNAREIVVYFNNFSPLTSPELAESALHDLDKDLGRRRFKEGQTHNIICDSCMIYPMAGVRWNCQSCYDFDVCFKCYWHIKETHDPTHKFTSTPETGIGDRRLPEWECAPSSSQGSDKDGELAREQELAEGQGLDEDRQAAGNT